MTVYDDADSDLVGSGSGESRCVGALPPVGTAFVTGDCAASDTAAWRAVTVYDDQDSDQFGTGVGTTRCVGVVAPAGTAFATGDCAENDRDRFANLSYEARDGDGDGFAVMSRGSICGGASLPRGYSAAIGTDPVDCDDGDYSAWRMVAVYEDVDGDGVGSGRLSVRCIGSRAPAGLSMLGYDPLDVLGDPDSLRISDFDSEIRSYLVQPRKRDDWWLL